MSEKISTVGVREKTRHILKIVSAKKRIPIIKLVEDLVNEKYGDVIEVEL